MKSTLLYEVIDESEITIDLDYDTVLARLRQMQGQCRESDCTDVPLYFHCDKKGKFIVSQHYRNGKQDGMYIHLKGSAHRNENKTTIKFCILKDKSTFLFSILSLIFDIALISFFILYFFVFKIEFDLMYVFYIVFAAFVTSVSFYNSFKRKKNVSFDSKILENEVLKRVEAIIHWDK